VVVGAEVTASVAGDDPGFFNYTDYEYSALRNLRVGVSAELRASRRIQLLGELRVDHGDHVQPFTLFVRVRPWPDRRFDIQAGRIPQTFGAFGRGGYGTANMLIGTPLAYQYLTSLRPDSLPSAPEDLLRMRGRGWLSTFPIGVTSPEHGLPIVNTMRADTGVQLHGVTGMLEWTGAITTGSLSNPRVRDDNDARQFVGRLVARPWPSLAVGVSAARAAYVSDVIEEALPAGRPEDGVQHVIGADVEYSQERFLARAEFLHAGWRLPYGLQGTNQRDLTAGSLAGEARYRIWPGFQLAARVERLGFGHLESTTSSWEAAVNRVEAGASYAIIRNITVKGSWQHNRRDGGRIQQDSLAALQVLYWF
jgi:hypothetical protein